MLEVLAVHRRAVKFEKGYTVFKRAGEKHLPFSDALAMMGECHQHQRAAGSAGRASAGSAGGYKHTSAQNRTHLFLAGHAGAQAGAKIADRGRKGLVIAKGVHLPAKGKKRAWRACGGLTGGKE